MTLSAAEPWGLALDAVPGAAFHAVTDGIAWLRIEDGRIAEHWANRDDQAMFRQLGIHPPDSTPETLTAPEVAAALPAMYVASRSVSVRSSENDAPTMSLLPELVTVIV